MEVRRIDPSDEAGLAESAAVLRASDEELWPDFRGFTLTDIRAYAQFRGASTRYELLAAGDPGGPILGVGLVESPLRDNRHGTEITVAVHPASRRRGVGTAIVEAVSERARADGRTVLNSIVDVPVDRARDHASKSFAPRVGFEAVLPGNTRRLALPMDEGLLDELRVEVARARDAAAYRVLTFDAPWPDRYLEDQCALYRCMSTDEPHGDGDHEAEVWDAERLHERDALHAARRVRYFVSVAEHRASGRLVACTELLVSEESPDQAGQMLTVVHPEHRGHRLGLAVKLANLDALTRAVPAVRAIYTGNAAVNAPMIAVNEVMGFEVAGTGHFWQKQL